jgi:GTP-binding protein HflX
MIVVRETLTSLDLASRESLVVFNKADALRGAEGAALREALSAEFPAAVFVSARTGDGVDALRERLGAIAASRWTKVDVTLPYAQGALVQRVRERGSLRNTEYGEAGIRIQADVPPDLAAELGQRGKASSARR